MTLMACCLQACNQRPVKQCDTYAEADDPNTTWVDWSGVKGLQYSFGTINQRYAKSQIPAVTPSTEWFGAGWRGECLSAQLVLWSDKEVEQVEFEFSPFTSKNGSTIDPSVAQARFVRYVLTDEFGRGCGYRKPEDFPVSLSADALDNVDCFNLKACTTLPVWLTFDIPPTAAPGIYSGTLSLYAQGEGKKKLKVNLEVLPQLLPEPQDWAFHLDMWQHPAAVARVHGVKCWSEEHWQLLETPMRMLAEAGQKVITANINKDPWNHQCFDAYEDMIFWTKETDGTWRYDYAVFDRWITFMLSLGVNKQINCYSMIPWNNEIHYQDEKSGELITSDAKPGTKDFEAIWTPFLLSFKAHLAEKGWLDITNIAMDERPPKEMTATIELIDKIAPELGIAIQDNHKSYKQFPMIRDICISLRGAFDEEDLLFRKANGLNSTYYVCCSHKFPNIFTFSDPAEAVYMAWHAKAAGFDGFLHWSYNSWVENPLTDSRFRSWPAGDTYVIYPDGRSSIRFERIKEGIQDAEKIRILREKFETEGNTDKLKRLDDMLSPFSSRRPPEMPLGEFVDQAKTVLTELSR